MQCVQCWASFLVYWYNTLKRGCYYAALYIAIFHVLFMYCSAHVINGGDSSEFYYPFFKFSQPGLAVVAGSLILVFSFFVLLACIMLIYALENENKCMFFPFIICMTIEILTLIVHGNWCTFGYCRNNIRMLIANMILFIYTGLNLYCLARVISLYKILRRFQGVGEPHFFVLHPEGCLYCRVFKR